LEKEHGSWLEMGKGARILDEDWGRSTDPGRVVVEGLGGGGRGCSTGVAAAAGLRDEGSQRWLFAVALP
jgi:hypothetical protein